MNVAVLGGQEGIWALLNTIPTAEEYSSARGYQELLSDKNDPKSSKLGEAEHFIVEMSTLSQLELRIQVLTFVIYERVVFVLILLLLIIKSSCRWLVLSTRTLPS